MINTGKHQLNKIISKMTLTFGDRKKEKKTLTTIKCEILRWGDIVRTRIQLSKSMN